MKTIKFSEYKEKVVELYENVYKILDKNNITWWIHSGTLLGLKRHNGKMIPWDDDIDIMVPANQWKEKIYTIDADLNQLNYKLIDWTFTDLRIRSDAWFAKIYSNEEYNVISDDGKFKSPYPQRPFIDIFYSVPSESFDKEWKWKKYEFYVKIQWTLRPGFDRYLAAKNNKQKNFLMNFISYPMKFFFKEENVLKYLEKPFNENEGWNKVRRADPWATRKVIYNLKTGLVENKFEGKKTFHNKEWEQELIETFGKDWNIEAYTTPHIFLEYYGKWERANEIKKILDEYYK